MSCPPDKIIFDAERGEYICTETGEVLEDRVVDEGIDWRAYNVEQFEDRARAKAINPNNFVNSGFLPTTAIKPKKMKKCAIYSNNKRILVHALRFLSSTVEKLNANDAIKQEAGRILQKLWKNKHLRYLGYEIIVLVSIYLAYRKLKIIMPFDEYYKKVDELFGIPKKEFVSMYFRILKEFDEKIPRFIIEDYIKECGVRLELPIEIIEKALNIAKEIEAQGKNPKTVACTILYYLAKQSGYLITQPMIEEKCGVTGAGLRKNAKILNLKM
ncbi:putative transcription initiation factor B [Saccharolobus solfataricus rod-shaped virus 1]|uniref:Putative transcription initiation factor B n=1 Tax=Saccharolobus solfataricus rod-shaped virus 1 TaxID=2730619 RepID=A0A6M3VXQ0_SSRV1|nr:putative transcription initiation factor B [Saccharolobus solfataricus rod-shaped virus 1]QJF12306.1 putative transcription initiation factor B [Saccharolobus solfataricus rod-shaped virus 1]